MTNPHDRLIRETLQDKEDAISFFKNSLPEKVIELLDLNRLELRAGLKTTYQKS
ncbi:Rpn family recombination-promoting nuclease/putative transposase [Leptospira kirschneri]|uniref:Rpn family recombination-promoting nuclease/putative transposase n=1 Tax=Leptospira kirschneri TaxID=29507 RepID=UPI001E645D64|nr:Rpn family recombination-promoting nuclease/putative transposase [Leptospira kirschneri]